MFHIDENLDSEEQEKEDSVIANELHLGSNRNKRTSLKELAKQAQEPTVTSELVEYESDSDEEFFKSLTATQTQYIHIKMFEPEISKLELKSRLKISYKELAKLNRDSRLENYLSNYFNQRIKRFQQSEIASIELLTRELNKEVVKRFSEDKRLNAQDLIDSGYTAQEARLILQTRPEGIPLKDLIKLRTDVSANVIERVSETPDTENVEVIEELSVNYRRYRAMRMRVDPKAYDPGQGGGFNITKVDTKKIKDLKQEPIDTEFEVKEDD